MKRRSILCILTLCLMTTISLVYHVTDADPPSAVMAQLTENSDWRLILVNSSHPLPDKFAVTLTELSNGICVDDRIYPDLQQMFDDARKDGLSPVVGEGFRTREAQQKMMNDKINTYINEGYSKKEAEKLAKNSVAEPGTSEHELGIALDINAADRDNNWDVYTWLDDNAYKYGFIQRYPYGKEDITGIEYEPWHYRYVGRKAAEEIYDQGITLEEYLSQ